MGAKPPQQSTSGSDGNNREVPSKKLRAIQNAFNFVDKDKNGSLDIEEWGALCDNIKAQDCHISDEEKAKLFEKVTGSAHGRITLHTFADWCMEADDEETGIAKWAAAEGVHELHRAVINEDLDGLKKSLAEGANVNVPDLQQVTPLHWACRRSNVEAGQALLEAKADVTLKTDLGRIPLHAASEAGSIALVKLLLDARSDINAPDVRNQTPLHWAVRASKEETVEFLLNAGADIGVKTCGGYTARGMAEDFSTYSMTALLDKHGAQR